MIGAEDRDDAPDAWGDATEYGPGGDAFWDGVGEPARDRSGPVRSWWLRNLYYAARRAAPDAGEPVWERMVRWLAEGENAGEYATFATSDVYNGSGGSWRMNYKEIAADLPAAFEWATMTEARSEDLETLLARPDRDASVAPREPDGAALVEARDGAGARANLRRAINAVRDRWPRPCATCKTSFRPEHRKVIRCPSCRAAAKARRGPKVVR